MKILNVLEVINGVVYTPFFSFIVTEDDNQQLNPDAITAAEDFFEKLVRERFMLPTSDWESEEIESAVDQALMDWSYDDRNGYQVILCYSKIK